MLPSAKCTRPLFQGRTGCGGRPSGWHDIVTCQRLVSFDICNVARVSFNVAGVSFNVARVFCNVARVSCNVAGVSCHVARVSCNAATLHETRAILQETFATLQKTRDLEIGVRGHSKSLKFVPFENLRAVSYSPSIVTMAVSVAVCEIFSVKEWCDLKTGLGFVQGH